MNGGQNLTPSFEMTSDFETWFLKRHGKTLAQAWTDREPPRKHIESLCEAWAVSKKQTDRELTEAVRRLSEISLVCAGAGATLDPMPDDGPALTAVKQMATALRNHGIGKT